MRTQLEKYNHALRRAQLALERLIITREKIERKMARLTEKSLNPGEKHEPHDIA
jgi:hypothetical protein